MFRRVLCRGAAGEPPGSDPGLGAEVSHPRSSQVQDRILGTEKVQPMKLLSGYGEPVAGPYNGLESERFYV